jgi:hypothetical protein
MVFWFHVIFILYFVGYVFNLICLVVFLLCFDVIIFSNFILYTKRPFILENRVLYVYVCVCVGGGTWKHGGGRDAVLPQQS